MFIMLIIFLFNLKSPLDNGNLAGNINKFDTFRLQIGVPGASQKMNQPCCLSNLSLPAIFKNWTPKNQDWGTCLTKN